MRREALRAMLRTRGAGWMDDPTNEDHSYERPRVRAALDEPGIAAALKVAEAAGRNRSDLDARAASLIRRHASRPARGLFRLDPAFTDEEDRAAAIHALRLLLSTIGGLPMLPEEAAVTSLLEALGKGGSHRATLARVLVDARRTGIFLLREARGLPAPMRAVDGMLWDGRVRVSMRKAAAAPVVRAGAVLPRGESVAGTLPHPFPLPDVPESLVRAALAAEPEVDCAGENVALMPVIAPFARFLPGFDVQSAGILAELAMASPLPPLPLPNAAV
jgi:tRNA(Ile)-lysidine synthase